MTRRAAVTHPVVMPMRLTSLAAAVKLTMLQLIVSKVMTLLVLLVYNSNAQGSYIAQLQVVQNPLLS